MEAARKAVQITQDGVPEGGILQVPSIS